MFSYGKLTFLVMCNLADVKLGACASHMSELELLSDFLKMQIHYSQCNARQVFRCKLC